MTTLTQLDFKPIMNIGMIGHVSDGKSTIVKALTKIATQKHSDEKTKNITIKLGYANAKILKCKYCPRPQCYFSLQSKSFDYKCPRCNGSAELLNHVSFVDCPGHNYLLATMINGTAVMDYTILVESSVNPVIPAPQTVEHIKAINTNSNIKNIITCLNKIDLQSKDKIIEQCGELQEYLKSVNDTSILLPVSATFDINLDVLCEILGNLPKPHRNSDQFKMPIIRSFNTNKPGTSINDLKGGVAGGSIISGSVKQNDLVYLYPGIILSSDVDTFKPVEAIVLNIYSESNKLETGTTGGLIGIELDIDPGLTVDDGLVGNIITKNNLGIVSKNFSFCSNNKFKLNRTYIFNINSNNINGSIKNKSDNLYDIILDKYIYLENNNIIVISEQTNDTIKLIGNGIFNMETCKFIKLNSNL
jgi:translation initiation factor 2 subunit 3